MLQLRPFARRAGGSACPLATFKSGNLALCSSPRQAPHKRSMAPLPLLLAAFLYVAFGAVASAVPALHPGTTAFLLGVVIAYITNSSSNNADMLVASVTLWLTSSSGVTSMLLIPPLIHTRLLALASPAAPPLSVSTSIACRACSALTSITPAAPILVPVSLVVRHGQLCGLVCCARRHAAFIQHGLVLAAERRSSSGAERWQQASASSTTFPSTCTPCFVLICRRLLSRSVSWTTAAPVFDLPSPRPRSLSLLRFLRCDSLIAPALAAALVNASLQADGIGNLAAAVSGNMAGNFCWNLVIGAFCGCSFAALVLFLLHFARTSAAELTLTITAVCVTTTPLSLRDTHLITSLVSSHNRFLTQLQVGHVLCH